MKQIVLVAETRNGGEMELVYPTRVIALRAQSNFRAAGVRVRVEVRDTTWDAWAMRTAYLLPAPARRAASCGGDVVAHDDSAQGLTR